jgi:hypothetical protein
MKPADWTVDDVRDFQSMHRDWEGNALSADGLWGPKSEWAYGISRLPLWRQDVVGYACRFVGRVPEWPASSNTDKEGQIKAWLAAVGVHTPAPWCAAFASAALKCAQISFEPSAGALRLGRSLHPIMYGDVLPGDVLFYPTDDKGSGHIGIVIANRIPGWPAQIASVEGNRNNNVRAQRRRIEGLSFASLVEPQDFVDAPMTLELVNMKVATR